MALLVKSWLELLRNYRFKYCCIRFFPRKLASLRGHYLGIAVEYCLFRHSAVVLIRATYPRT
jgi:hypothetical protein